MKKNKKFDCVKMKNEIQKKLIGKNREKLNKELLKNPTLSKFLKQNQ